MAAFLYISSGFVVVNVPLDSRKQYLQLKRI